MVFSLAYIFTAVTQASMSQSHWEIFHPPQLTTFAFLSRQEQIFGSASTTLWSCGVSGPLYLDMPQSLSRIPWWYREILFKTCLFPRTHPRGEAEALCSLLFNLGNWIDDGWVLRNRGIGLHFFMSPHNHPDTLLFWSFLISLKPWRLSLLFNEGWGEEIRNRLDWLFIYHLFYVLLMEFMPGVWLFLRHFILKVSNK